MSATTEPGDADDDLEFAITVAELTQWLGKAVLDDGRNYRVLASFAGGAWAVTGCECTSGRVVIACATRGAEDENALEAGALVTALRALEVGGDSVVCLGSEHTIATGWTASRPSRRVLITE